MRRGSAGRKSEAGQGLEESSGTESQLNEVFGRLELQGLSGDVAKERSERTVAELPLGANRGQAQSLGRCGCDCGALTRQVDPFPKEANDFESILYIVGVWVVPGQIGHIERHLVVSDHCRFCGSLQISQVELPEELRIASPLRLRVLGRGFGTVVVAGSRHVCGKKV